MDERFERIETRRGNHFTLLEDVALVVALHGGRLTIRGMLELLPRESIQIFRDEAYSNPHYQQTGHDARIEWAGRCSMFDSEAQSLTLNAYGQSLVEEALERAPTDLALRERLAHILDSVRAKQTSKIPS